MSERIGTPRANSNTSITHRKPVLAGKWRMAGEEEARKLTAVHKRPGFGRFHPDRLVVYELTTGHLAAGLYFLPDEWSCIISEMWAEEGHVIAIREGLRYIQTKYPEVESFSGYTLNARLASALILQGRGQTELQKICYHLTFKTGPQETKE